MKLTIDTIEGKLTRETEAETRVLELYSKEAFQLISQQWLKIGWNQKYPYTFSWLGRPIVQLPEDMIRVQEVIYRVRPDVLKKYATIRMRRGLAMAPVKNGTCQGCNMNIPPQVFNQLQRGDTIELCGNCNRIIYWDKLLENPDGSPSEPGK